VSFERVVPTLLQFVDNLDVLILWNNIEIYFCAINGKYQWRKIYHIIPDSFGKTDFVWETVRRIFH